MPQYTSLSVADLTTNERYKLLIGSIVPRPIAWVTTVGADGTTNLAPFSFFNGLSSNPMCLMISVNYQPDGGLKDTARNILETKEFVVHQSPVSAIEQVHGSAAAMDYSVSEIEALGLRTLPSDVVRPPRIADSPIHMECTLHDKLEIGEGSGGTIVFVGEVVRIHIQSHALENGRVLLDRIDPVARMGGPTYMKIGETFEISKPKG